MNPSTYSTKHPIVLSIKSHDWAVTHEVITKSITLNVDQAKHALQMTIDEESVSATGKPNQYGIMAAIGWHRSYDPATDVVFYNTCLTKLPSVAQEYCDRLFTLLPHAGHQIVSESMERYSFDMVSFDQGTTPQRPFTNSLTLTHNDFANYLHTDCDHIPITYGMWWVSKDEMLEAPFNFIPKLIIIAFLVVPFSGKMQRAASATSTKVTKQPKMV
ncbi:hypothetical protein DFJ58DRAFT_848842 [Suillus subalutaceus]|uniref:uncharacterized protein n=1 Tax=Suillus subalutaceus TaxID=48586 RepID=UPI001B868E98|nr:uncharacterized protein DFJ58DRAFT_848842 [Suillus subalutaceus]KAG1829044.1 hypothetical protein DFJ58DRAFT_848842 [Suillus subalutaceus]